MSKLQKEVNKGVDANKEKVANKKPVGDHTHESTGNEANPDANNSNDYRHGQEMEEAPQQAPDHSDPNHKD